MAGAGILRKLLGKKAGSTVPRKELTEVKSSLKKDLDTAKKLRREQGGSGPAKAVRNIKLDIKKLNKLKPKTEKPISQPINKEKKKAQLDPTPSSFRSAVLQAQQYKKLQSGLQKEYDRTKAMYEKLKDKTSEKAMLMRNKLKAMEKKLKGKKSIPMLPEGKAQGGLQMPTANQTGLKKLPTAVRNKMGYMYGGGMSKKPKMSSMDYRKGGMVLIALNLMKKKGKSK